MNSRLLICPTPGIGNDHVAATGNNNTLDGGAGNDAWIGLGTFANLQTYMSQVGNDVLISFDVGHSLTLQNVALGTLNQNHFDLA